MQDLFPVSDWPADHDPALMQPLVLAYLGDSLYDLYVRTRLTRSCQAQSGQLHSKSVRFVCAKGQARSLAALTLTPEEEDMVRRGRNAKPGTVAKHASLADYHAATAFEALLGYLYLKGRFDRAREIMDLAFQAAEKEDKHAPGTP